MTLRNRRVLVTGATGFIGCRLAERLAIEEGAVVTGIGRNLDKVSHLREAGVTLRQLDLTETSRLPEVLAGQEVVFHLAAAKGDSSNDPIISKQLNVTATEALVREAAAAGVARFIHTSTMAVYGAPDGQLMEEDHPLDVAQSAPYGRTKALGEMQARKLAHELGLDLVVVRPGMVFGPRGWSWSIVLLRLVQRRVPVIFGDGLGHAQPVYVDNLIDGMILVATQPQAPGNVFNFVDQPLPWRDFFGYYGAMCGRKPLAVPLWLARAILPIYMRMSGRAESVNDLLQFYTAKPVYPITKAEQLLGFRPRISIEEGMKRTKAWFCEEGYL